MFCSSIQGLATTWTHFLHLSLSSVILIDSSPGSQVHVLMLSIQAVLDLPRLRAPGIVPCIISFSWHSRVYSWCDHSMLASLLWQCLTVPSLLQLSELFPVQFSHKVNQVQRISYAHHSHPDHPWEIESNAFLKSTKHIKWLLRFVIWSLVPLPCRNPTCLDNLEMSRNWQNVRKVSAKESCQWKLFIANFTFWTSTVFSRLSRALYDMFYALLGRLFDRVDLIKPVFHICPSVRSRPFTKSFFLISMTFGM